MSKLTVKEFRNFDAQAERERKENADIRADGVGLLTPKLLRDAIKKKQDIVLAYGRNGDPQKYTLAELKEFAAKVKEAQGLRVSSVRGMPLLALESASRAKDIERAGQVGPATLYKIERDMLYFRVRGIQQPFYQVRVRMEDFNAAITSLESNRKLVARSVAMGRLSIDCACGRHQYWYRYLANIGNYDIDPPKEQDFPKILNNQLTGCCCKHVLKVLKALRSPAIHLVIAKELERQADAVGYASNTKSRLLSRKDLESVAKKRKGTTDYSGAKAALSSFMAEAKKYLKKVEKDEAIKAKKAKLKAKKTPTARIASTMPEHKARVIEDIFTENRENKKSLESMLNQAVGFLGVTRAQIDAVIRERNL